MKRRYAIALTLTGMMGLALSASAQMQPKMATIRGSIVDLTCASKGYAMGMKWANTKEDHMMEGGKTQKDCATMCLKGGQPAAVFSGTTLTAVLACDPRPTLAGHASDQVELQGFWAGDNQDVKTFVPQKIRAGAGAWNNVTCAEMH